MDIRIQIATKFLTFFLIFATGTSVLFADYSLGVRIELAQAMTHPGDEFWVTGYLDNPGPGVLEDVPVCFVLEVYGAYWFWPSWVHYAPPESMEYDLEFMAVPVGSRMIEVLETFIWPDTGSDQVEGLYFHGLMLNDDMSAIRGTPASVSFGYGPLYTPTPMNNTYTPTPNATPRYVSVGNLISISSGSFTQGSPDNEPCNGFDEQQFTHHLTRNLSVMETEITRQMWEDLKTEQPTLPEDPSNSEYSPTMNHPVQQSTWFETILFANLLSLQNGYLRCYYADLGFTTPITSENYTVGSFFCDFEADGYRLPTEGEWEYFTRAGTMSPFSCDETHYTTQSCGAPYCVSGEFPILEQYCVFCANAMESAEIVGSKVANPWGLKDVHGNVPEWCWDVYDNYPGTEQTDYAGPATGPDRVRRGGGWGSHSETCRSADRVSVGPEIRSGGFRLLRSVD